MTTILDPFKEVRRQEFRRYFQPSRIVLCLLPSPDTESGVNVITLSFNMYCSYKPPMMAVAIQRINHSYELIQRTSEFVLAVPGDAMAYEALQCGLVSQRKADKVKSLRLTLHASKKVAVPGLAAAIANIEIAKRAQVICGDHVLVMGEVLRFAVNKDISQSPLVSLGPNTSGFNVLQTSGIHRIGTVAQQSPSRK